MDILPDLLDIPTADPALAEFVAEQTHFLTVTEGCLPSIHRECPRDPAGTGSAPRSCPAFWRPALTSRKFPAVSTCSLQRRRSATRLSGSPPRPTTAMATTTTARMIITALHLEQTPTMPPPCETGTATASVTMAAAVAAVI